MAWIQATPGGEMHEPLRAYTRSWLRPVLWSVKDQQPLLPTGYSIDYMPPPLQQGSHEDERRLRCRVQIPSRPAGDVLWVRIGSNPCCCPLRASNSVVCLSACMQLGIGALQEESRIDLCSLCPWTAALPVLSGPAAAEVAGGSAGRAAMAAELSSVLEVVLMLEQQLTWTGHVRGTEASSKSLLQQLDGIERLARLESLSGIAEFLADVRARLRRCRAEPQTGLSLLWLRRSLWHYFKIRPEGRLPASYAALLSSPVPSNATPGCFRCRRTADAVEQPRPRRNDSCPSFVRQRCVQGNGAPATRLALHRRRLLARGSGPWPRQGAPQRRLPYREWPSAGLPVSGGISVARRRRPTLPAPAVALPARSCSSCPSGSSHYASAPSPCLSSRSAWSAGVPSSCASRI